MMWDLVSEIIQDVLCYHVGTGLLWLVTLGRYPRTDVAEKEKTRIIVVGWCVLLAIIIAAWFIFK
jgi:ABC-type transport system involved in cytochrome c biogenesis permease subunit